MIRLALILVIVLCGSGPAVAAEKVFAVVPKMLNNPFFDFARDGCKKAEQELGIECLYMGPSDPDEQEQIKIIQDLINRRVDGIAVAPLNAPAVGRVLKRAKASGIPVVTWDSDLLPEDKGLRAAYIGTHNYEIGVNLGKELLKRKQGGGTLAIQSGFPASQNLSERVQGVRDTIKGHGWTEVAGSPFNCSDSATVAVQQLADVLLKHPNLDAFVPVGGWPQFAPRAYEQAVTKQLQRMKEGSFLVIATDTLPPQMNFLKRGLSHVQVGQRPFDMGYKAMLALRDLGEKKSIPDPMYTSLDICTSETIETCTAGKG